MPIRNTDTQYAIRNTPQSANTQYGYAIRNTKHTSKCQYAIRIRNPQSATALKAANTQYGYAIRDPKHTSHLPIRNTDTQYAIRSRPHAAWCSGTQYAIRNAKRQQKQLSQCTIRNTQCAEALKPALLPPSHGLSIRKWCLSTHYLNTERKPYITPLFVPCYKAHSARRAS